MDRVEQADALLRQLLGENAYQSFTKRLETKQCWICVGAWQVRAEGRSANALFVLKLFLNDGHVDLYLEYPTYPSRVSGHADFVAQVAQATEVQGKQEIREQPTVVDPADQKERKAVWISFGVGFPVERMTIEHLRVIFTRLRSAIATCSARIPEVGAQ